MTPPLPRNSSSEPMGRSHYTVHLRVDLEGPDLDWARVAASLKRRVGMLHSLPEGLALMSVEIETVVDD